MKLKTNLAHQLLFLIIVIISIIVISLGFILPKNLLPIYENNIYSYLKQPLNFVGTNLNNNNIDSELAYIYVSSDDVILKSDNLTDIIKANDIHDILERTNLEYGNFKYKGKTYYYYTSKEYNVLKIALTDDSYINKMRRSIFKTIFYTVGITYVIVTVLLLSWANNLVSKIMKLREKVKNIDNDNYNHELKFKIDDEFYMLDESIEHMRLYLKEHEEYKNQMYQNISHDFKTPITVMKSYIEALEDGIESKDKTLAVIKEQINKLEMKVHSLLYLNKINYIKARTDGLTGECDILPLLESSITKFKVIRPDVSFTLDGGKKKQIFRGTDNMWEAIIDNILGNFVRYAIKEIKVTIKSNQIIFYNDGPNIEKDVLSSIFTPYEKGVNGVFGLGLSIVKKTLELLNYDIMIVNERKGVKFIIK